MNESTTQLKPVTSCPHLAADTSEFADSYYQTLATAHQHGSIAYDETHGRAFIVGYDAVTQAAKDWGTFSSAGSVSGIPDSEVRLLPVECDPPEHKEWRDILAGWFAASAVADLDDLIRGSVDTFIDAFAERGSCEAIAELARPLPGRIVFEHLLNLSGDDMERCEELVGMFVGDDMQGRIEAVTQLGIYVLQHILTRRAAEPVDDLIGSILSAEVGGAPVSDTDATSLIVTLIIGSLETTKSALASMLLHFAEQPEDRERIAADRSRLRDAVEESLRMYTPATYLVRQITADAQLDGVQLDGGGTIAISFAAACRDPEKFANPDVFDMDRRPNRHYGLGVGTHYCLGAHLARAIMIAVLDRALDRMPNWRTPVGWTPVYEVAGVRTLASLELEFDPEGQHQ